MPKGDAERSSSAETPFGAFGYPTPMVRLR